MPPDLALLSTLNGSNYPCLELIFMVPKVFEPLKFVCSYIGHTYKYMLSYTIYLDVCRYMSMYIRQFYKGDNFYEILYFSMNDIKRKKKLSKWSHLKGKNTPLEVHVFLSELKPIEKGIKNDDGRELLSVKV